MSLATAVEALLARETGRASRVARREPVGGGCINNAEVFHLEDGRAFFVKSNAAPLPGMFEREAEGLAALAAAGAIRVPRPIGTGGGDDGVAPFLVMEHIVPGRPGTRFEEQLGRGLALLHQATRGPRFGLDHDNYLGSTPQPNGWMDDWVAFWRERRLGHQVRLARANGLATPELLRLAERLSGRLDDLIGQPDEPACLLHGDLWGGNKMAGPAGEPVLIDPAAYHGRREADLAMTRLFGGFGPRFYAAYEEAWPLADGAEDRNAVYELYHLLNHLNLFGDGYLGGCLAILRRLAT